MAGLAVDEYVSDYGFRTAVLPLFDVETNRQGNTRVAPPVQAAAVSARPRGPTRVLLYLWYGKRTVNGSRKSVLCVESSISHMCHDPIGAMFRGFEFCFRERSRTGPIYDRLRRRRRAYAT